MGNRINLVISVTALVVAVGGATPLGEAAWNQVLPRNSVGTLQLQRNAVKSSKLAPNAVRTAHVVNGSLLAADFKAGQLPSGPKGDKGEKGDRGERGPVGLSGYEIIRASTIVPANTTSTAQAVCPRGKKVIGGAAGVQGVPSGVFMHTQVTENAVSGDYWDNIVVNTTAVPRQANAIAICANVAG
jgi:hypothetical protein